VRALVSLLARVFGAVAPQRVVVGRAVLAVRTAERLLARVLAQVDAQVRLRRRVVAAVVAQVAADLEVHRVLVRAQQPPVGQHLTAQVAQVPRRTLRRRRRRVRSVQILMDDGTSKIAINTNENPQMK